MQDLLGPYCHHHRCHHCHYDHLDHHQCSSSGLDTLVSLSKQCGALGARLTGAGWGGCIVALVINNDGQHKYAGDFYDHDDGDVYEIRVVHDKEIDGAAALSLW